MLNALLKRLPEVLFVGMIFPAFTFALDCNPWANSQWFDDSLVFDKSSFPSGVVVEEGMIVNQSTVPLYIPFSPESIPFLESMIKGDAREIKSHPFASDNASKFTPKLSILRLVNGKTDRLYHSFDNKEFAVVPGGNSEMDLKMWNVALGFTNKNLRSKDRFGPGRPFKLFLKEPEPDNIIIPAFYGNKKIEIQAKIVYVLNKDYQPEERGCDTYTNPEKSWLATKKLLSPYTVFAGTLVLTLFGYVFYLIKKYRNK